MYTGVRNWEAPCQFGMFYRDHAHARTASLPPAPRHSACGLASRRPGSGRHGSERVARITARMQAFVDKGTIPGAVIVIQRHGNPVALTAVSYLDLEAKTPLLA